MPSFPFQNWLTTNFLIGGDWRFFWPENLREIFSYSYAWDSSLNTGIGRTNVIPWLNAYLAYLGHFYIQVLHIPWNISEKLLFFLPILLLSFFSVFYLSKLLISDKRHRALAGFLYCLNTYALMIFSGGQVGVALAYSMAPLVLARFIKLINFLNSSSQNCKLQSANWRTNFKFPVIAGLILAVQAMFEPRVAYITLMAVAVYFAIYSLFIIKKLKKIIEVSFFVFVIPGLVAVLLHSFWILSFLIYRQNFVEQLGSAYGAKGMVQFLSFADFSHALSLLHPNWPENIFGKVYFMRPEFLILPILAFSSLLFMKHETHNTKHIGNNNEKLFNNLAIEQFNNQIIIFFAILGLIGAFLAKGTNEPFGGVYVWLFNYFPGMSMFRDPTKFYILVALSYSILIPYSVGHIYEWIKSTGIRKYLPSLFLLLTTCYLLLLIRPAFLGELGGTFKQHEVPKEYVELKNFIANQPEFFRTFWVPQRQRFGFFSNNHPAIDSLDLLKVASASGVIDWLSKSEAKEQLSLWSVKYLIIPDDSEGEIFLEDRKYSLQKRKEIEDELDKIPWLKKINLSDKIVVYETPEQKDHFWVEQVQGLTSGVNYQMVNPTKYAVSVKNLMGPAVLVFSENFDTGWIAKIDGQEILSEKVYNRLNSFFLDRTGDFVVLVEFRPQRYVYLGLIISSITLLVCGSILSLKVFKRRFTK